MFISKTDLNSKSALYCIRYGEKISNRIVYGVYLIIGVVFFGIGIFTALNVLLRLLGGSVFELMTVLFICYVIINLIIGYGFVFYKKWLVTALTGNLILIGLFSIYFLFIGDVYRLTSFSTSIKILSPLLIFLLATKKLLNGLYIEKWVLVVFFLLLLFSFAVNSFVLLY